MYKIILGDSKEILKTFDSESIDTLISDIPYGVNINPEWDKNLPSDAIWKECYRVLKPGSHCIIFGQPSMVMDLMDVMSNTKFEYRDMWIWQYQGTHTKGFKIEEDGSLYRSRIRNVFNPIYVFRKSLLKSEKDNWETYRTNLLNIDSVREPYEGNHSKILENFKKTGKRHLQSEVPSNTFKTMKRKGWVPDERGREPVNLMYFTRATKAERTINGIVENNHETVKPLSLMAWLIKLTTNNENQIVLDPFCGSGSTGCACKLLNRNFIGIDIDEHSVSIAKARIDNITNFFT
jgi:site-specific DNA-methyltransferase (adenine-specific)